MLRGIRKRIYWNTNKFLYVWCAWAAWEHSKLFIGQRGENYYTPTGNICVASRYEKFMKTVFSLLVRLNTNTTLYECALILFHFDVYMQRRGWLCKEHKRFRNRYANINSKADYHLWLRPILELGSLNIHEETHDIDKQNNNTSTML